MVTRTGEGGLRIVFFGTPAFAAHSLEALLASRHKVVAVVTQPDRPRGRGQRVQPSPVKAVALAAGLPVQQPTRLKDDAWLDQLRALAPDLGVVAAYGRLLPDVLLAVPRLGMVNVHASLLPRYRGASPIHQAVLAGDTTTGVTIMRVVRELDAGPMLDAVELPIGPDDTTGEVEARLAVAGATLLVNVVDRMARGPVHETPQNEADVTFAPRLEKTRGLIDWTQPAAVVHNQVRGLQPWPGTWTYLDGQRLAIRRTTLVTGPRRDGTAGTVYVDAGGLQVACGDGRLVELVDVQPEGRRAMTGREFLAGRQIAAGTQLSSSPT